MPHDIIDNRTRELAPEIASFLMIVSVPALPSAMSSCLASKLSPWTFAGDDPWPHPNLLSPAQPTPCPLTSCHRATLSGCAWGWSSARGTEVPGTCLSA
jgi:hypothetical protein